MILKMSLLIGVVSLTGGLGACSSGSSETTTTSSVETTTATTTTATTNASTDSSEKDIKNPFEAFQYKYTSGDYVLEDWKVVVTDVNDSNFISGVPYYSKWGKSNDNKVIYPSDGNVFMMIGVGIINNNNQPGIFLASLNQKAAGMDVAIINDNNEYTYSFASDEADKLVNREEMQGILCNSGEKKTVYLVYEVPKEIKDNGSEILCRINTALNDKPDNVYVKMR